MADRRLSAMVCVAVVLMAMMRSMAAPVSESLGLFVPSSKPACSGLIGDCFEEEEMLMDSEINERILAARRTYISYGALRADRVPCTRRGNSYYNCRAGGRANPYHRGCTQITRCARDTS